MKQLIVIALSTVALATLIAGERGRAERETSSPVKGYDTTSRESEQNTLEATLIGLEKGSWEAWKRRDGSFFQNFLSDDHVEVGNGGSATKTEVVAFVGSPVCVVKSYSVSNFKLTVFDANTALLTYHAEQDTTCGGRPVPSPVWVSSLYVKRGGHWLNALYQQTAATH